ncbi:MAG: tyrosine-protein phosphatase [Bdellovibrionales bacterium]|nr:tyrosine-protein phosphatase [Ramlibacter sp.]
MTTSQSPSRSLHLAGATNFRDLGGYAGHGGRLVRWRRLFRSDHLAALTAQDQHVLRELQVLRVCDFRGVQERSTAACIIEGAQVHSLPIEPTIVQRLSSMLQAGYKPGEAEVVALMQETYRNFVRENTPRFADLFGHLLVSDAPLVFHCTAGKDRTGFAAALILHALGVPRDVILHDYLLTNELLAPGPASHKVPPEIAAVLFRVQEPFLAAALHAVDEDHGSLDGYLTSALGVGPAQRAQLSAMYLQPASQS